MSTKILVGDALDQLAALPAESVHCCVTSPPYYGLRCYGVDGQIGLETTPEYHITKLVEVFREVRRVLRKDGVLWLNYGDAYAGSGKGPSNGESKQCTNMGSLIPGHRGAIGGFKPKDLLMMPARVALALQADGWWLRSQMPWLKRSAMPESATDRPATAIEYVFMLTKSARYFFDMEAVKQDAAYGDHHAKYQGSYQRHKFEALRQSGATNGEQYQQGLSRPAVNPHGRNFRNSDLFYASLEPPHGLISGPDGEPLALDVNPAGYSDAHFATFSPKLIEPLIKAATSEKGCCPDCSAPWVREVERTAMVIDRSDRTHEMGHTRSSGTMLEPPTAKTLGWFPSCGCKPELDGGSPQPCTILDCFGGAGTTGLVADRLGRNAILIEINPEYAEMARGRISGDSPLFAEVVS